MCSLHHNRITINDPLLILEEFKLCHQRQDPYPSHSHALQAPSGIRLCVDTCHHRLYPQNELVLYTVFLATSIRRLKQPLDDGTSAVDWNTPINYQPARPWTTSSLLLVGAAIAKNPNFPKNRISQSLPSVSSKWTDSDIQSPDESNPRITSHPRTPPPSRNGP